VTFGPELLGFATTKSGFPSLLKRRCYSLAYNKDIKQAGRRASAAPVWPASEGARAGFRSRARSVVIKTILIVLRVQRAGLGTSLV